MVSGTFGIGQRTRTTFVVSVPSGCFATTVNGSESGGSARYSWTVYRISSGQFTPGPDLSRPRATIVALAAVRVTTSLVKLRQPPVIGVRVEFHPFHACRIERVREGGLASKSPACRCDEPVCTTLRSIDEIRL